jgi:cellobiose dehydrogenase (acceptor)
MKSTFLATALLAASAYAQYTEEWTEPATGIKFQSMYTTINGGYRWGISMPTVATDEFIGHFTATINDKWAGTSFGGQMTNNLLLVAWPHDGKIMTSFRMAP